MGNSLRMRAECLLKVCSDAIVSVHFGPRALYNMAELHETHQNSGQQHFVMLKGNILKGSFIADIFKKKKCLLGDILFHV